MRAESYDVARERYWAAYQVQRNCANCVIQKLESGEDPSREDVAAEAKATEDLAGVWRDLLDTMAASERPRH